MGWHVESYCFDPAHPSMIGDKGPISIVQARKTQQPHDQNAGILGTWQCDDSWGLHRSLKKDLFLEKSCFVVIFGTKLNFFKPVR